MKLRPRIFLPLACLLLALPTCAGRAQTPGAITEARVLAVIAAMDKAARAAKVEGIVPHLADDVTFKATIDVGGMTQEVEFDREKFIAETRSAFGKRLAYEFRRQNVEVAISKDGQSAMVTNESFEKLTRREGAVSSVSSEILVFKLRGGRVVLTSYYATVRVFDVRAETPPSS